jgi:hypothetical protein
MANLERKLTEICNLDLDSICETPIVSPDSKKIAYPIKSTGWFSPGRKVFINGHTHENYQGVSGLVFSPDSQHIAYVAMKKHGMIVVRDNKEISDEYEDISRSTPIFSPDSQHLAFGAKRGNKWFAVKDGIEEIPHNGFVAGSMTFSPDSKLAYGYFEGQLIGRLQIGGKTIVMDDGNKIAEYDKGRGESLVEKSVLYSPDSKTLAYGAVRNGKHFVVIDGKEEKPHDKISEKICFSPDSKRYGYATIDNGIWSMILDGKKDKEYQGIGWHLFSPDSKSFAYHAFDNSGGLVIFNGKEKRKYPGGILSQFYGFSPDSKHFAYGVERGYDQFAVLDDIEHKKYSGIPQISLSFSPDSKHLVYAANKNNRSMTIVVNNNELDTDINLVLGASFVFDSPDKFHTLVISKNKIYRLDVEVMSR